jgi:hypothetical protein
MLRRCHALLALLVALGLGACGATPEGTTVARVGSRPITKSELRHWEKVIGARGAFGGFRGAPKGTVRQRALALLITSEWLIGEAVRQKVPISQAEVDGALTAREGEAGELHKRLAATGETSADLKFELRAELAGEAIREVLAERADAVTPREVAAYYQRNRRLLGTSPGDPPTAGARPSERVLEEAASRLRADHQRSLKASFDASYVSHWQAVTKCASGYTAPGCPRFAGSLGAYEDPFSARAHPMLEEQGPGS